MTGSKKVIGVLNGLLKSEFTAIHQYTAEARFFRNVNYDRLADYEMDRAKEEMHHLKRLESRIYLLGGQPSVGVVGEVDLGRDAGAIIQEDEALEVDAVGLYEASITICEDEKDFDTRRLLEEILEDETKHLRRIEALQTQIAEMGMQNFLSANVR